MTIEKMLQFHILTSNSDQKLDQEEQPILINIDHIVSIKPIKMVIEHEVLSGYWIRTSNGKKYRATKIPSELIQQLESLEKKSLNNGNTISAIKEEIVLQ
ncbi:MAG: hypothetical protein HOJ35_00720 [Bdellovibrionales bacterium]|jgi:hypothetical protein|nr:hypothetical protein [Bdellovibrionales bacterium]